MRSLILIMVIALSVGAHCEASVLRDSIYLNFRQSRNDLDTTYMGNAAALREARRSIAIYHRPDSNFVLRQVEVVGAASPEGSVEINRRLSRQRADRIFDYVKTLIDIPDSLTTFTFLGRDWGGLREMVREDPKVPYREDVITTIDAILADGNETEAQLARIKRLHRGTPYRYMYGHLFPDLRASRLVLTFGRPLPSAPMAEIAPRWPDLTCGIAELAMVAIPLTDTVVPPAPKPFYMALKTNMLYDLLAIPNIGAEFYVGKNLSVVANWMYGWWKTDRRHRYWRAYGGDIALRWWFGSKAHEKPLTGHHVGLYGGVVTYDFEWGGRGYMGGLPGHDLWARCNHHFGVEYGYSLPIGRRFNIDFNIGLGYLGGEYREYVPKDNCYVWQATKHLHWVGPTKVEISLAWLIGRGNVNVKKGGGRL